MNYAKKLIVPTLCVLVGCAAGAAMGSVTAQTWPEPTNVQRWQQECPEIAGNSISGQRANANAMLRERGAQGWEAFTFGGYACFKRPAP